MAKSRLMSEIREWVESIAVAFVIAVVLQTFVVQAFKIPSGSMIPTFNIGDRIFVNKFLYCARVPFVNLRLPVMDVKRPVRGEIIVFQSPEDPKKDFVKRLIASGGETVEIKDGSVLINGAPAREPSIAAQYYYNAGDYGRAGSAVTVPEDCYFVLGDNSANSKDSRYWGFIPKANIIGKAMCIYWPLNRIRTVK
jgi:signal peptidase I